MLHKSVIGRKLLILVASVATLAFAAPAFAGGAKEKEKEPVPVSASGVGIAPRAPEWVREQIKKIHAGKIEDGGADAPALVAPQARRRLAWFGCKDVWAYRGYDHVFGYNLFRYYQQVSWCSNGYSIYSWNRFRWAELNGPGWAFDGHIDSYLGGVDNQQARVDAGCVPRLLRLVVRLQGALGEHRGQRLRRLVGEHRGIALLAARIILVVLGVLATIYVLAILAMSSVFAHPTSGSGEGPYPARGATTHEP